MGSPVNSYKWPAPWEVKNKTVTLGFSQFRKTLWTREHLLTYIDPFTIMCINNQ